MPPFALASSSKFCDEAAVADLNHIAPHIPVELRRAWRLADPAIERDAEIFWREERLLPDGADAGARLPELCLTAYHDGKLVALSTVRIRFLDFLGVKLAMLRLATGRNERRNHLSRWVSYHSHQLLEEWSLAHPEEEVMGVGAVSQGAHHLSPSPRALAIGRTSGAVFIGWTANGDPMRVAWFAHGTFPRRRRRDQPFAADDWSDPEPQSGPVEES